MTNSFKIFTIFEHYYLTKFTNYDLIIITDCEEKKYFRSSLTEISRLVRGERKSLVEYIPEFHTENNV